MKYSNHITNTISTQQCSMMNKNSNKINASDVQTANNFYEDEMFPTSSLAAADCQN